MAKQKWGRGAMVHVHTQDLDFDGMVIHHEQETVSVMENGLPIRVRAVPEGFVFQRNPAPEEITAPPDYFVPGDRVDVLNVPGTIVLWHDVEVLGAYLEKDPALNWYELEMPDYARDTRFAQSRLRRTKTPFT